MGPSLMATYDHVRAFMVFGAANRTKSESGFHFCVVFFFFF